MECENGDETVWTSQILNSEIVQVILLHAMQSCTHCASIRLHAPGISNTKKSHVSFSSLPVSIRFDFSHWRPCYLSFDFFLENWIRL